MHPRNHDPPPVWNSWMSFSRYFKAKPTQFLLIYRSPSQILSHISRIASYLVFDTSIIAHAKSEKLLRIAPQQAGLANLSQYLLNNTSD